MKLKELFTSLAPSKKETNPSTYSDDSALISVNRFDYTPLSKIESLNEASSITAKGVWDCNDFIALKRKLRMGSPPYIANIILKEINLENIELDHNHNFIDYKELFNFCVNLSKVVLPDASSYGGKVDFRATFRGCSKLKEIYNLSTYRHISDLRGTFCYCTLLSSVELFSSPLPSGDSDTFQKVNRDIRVIVSRGVRIPSDWIQLDAENIVYGDQVFSDSISLK